MKKFDELVYSNATSGVVDTSWGPIKIGIYARYLERWFQYFSLTQFLFISGERLILDPALVLEITLSDCNCTTFQKMHFSFDLFRSFEMNRVQNFLGLKQVINEKHFYFNSTKGFPCLVKSEERSSPHCLGKSKGRNHPQIDRQIIRRLREFYRPFNSKFYQMTRINFGWV